MSEKTPAEEAVETLANDIVRAMAVDALAGLAEKQLTGGNKARGWTPAITTGYHGKHHCIIHVSDGEDDVPCGACNKPSRLLGAVCDGEDASDLKQVWLCPKCYNDHFALLGEETTPLSEINTKKDHNR